MASNAVYILQTDRSARFKAASQWTGNTFDTADIQPPLDRAGLSHTDSSTGSPRPSSRVDKPTKCADRFSRPALETRRQLIYQKRAAHNFSSSAHHSSIPSRRAARFPASSSSSSARPRAAPFPLGSCSSVSSRTRRPADLRKLFLAELCAPMLKPGRTGAPGRRRRPAVCTGRVSPHAGGGRRPSGEHGPRHPARLATCRRWQAAVR